MTISEIRRENLRELLLEYKTIVALSEVTGVDQNYISQILSQSPTKTGKPRAMGNSVARRLEKGVGKPEGWMDIDHQNIVVEIQYPSLSLDESELLRLYRASSVIKRRAIISVARIQEAQ